MTKKLLSLLLSAIVVLSLVFVSCEFEKDDDSVPVTVAQAEKDHVTLLKQTATKSQPTANSDANALRDKIGEAYSAEISAKGLVNLIAKYVLGGEMELPEATATVYSKGDDFAVTSPDIGAVYYYGKQCTVDIGKLVEYLPAGMINTDKTVFTLTEDALKDIASKAGDIELPSDIEGGSEIYSAFDTLFSEKLTADGSEKQTSYEIVNKYFDEMLETFYKIKPEAKEETVKCNGTDVDCLVLNYTVNKELLFTFSDATAAFLNANKAEALEFLSLISGEEITEATLADNEDLAVLFDAEKLRSKLNEGFDGIENPFDATVSLYIAKKTSCFAKFAFNFEARFDDGKVVLAIDVNGSDNNDANAPIEINASLAYTEKDKTEASTTVNVSYKRTVSDTADKYVLNSEIKATFSEAESPESNFDGTVLAYKFELNKKDGQYVADISSDLFEYLANSQTLPISAESIQVKGKYLLTATSFDFAVDSVSILTDTGALSCNNVFSVALKSEVTMPVAPEGVTCNTADEFAVALGFENFAQLTEAFQ